MYDQNERRLPDQRYGGEIVDLVIYFRIQRRIGDDARRTVEQGVAVRLRLGNELERDVAACAGAIIHDERLTGRVAEFLRDDAAHHINAAACGETRLGEGAKDDVGLKMDFGL